MLKIAVIGLGDISNIHIPFIQNNSKAELVAVCDIDDTLRHKVPNINFYTDYQEMIESESLDVVHICLPHFLHYPAAKYCLEKGLHVFLEKPLGLDSKEGCSLVELEEKYENSKICVCFQNRYNESFEKLQEMINSGEFGKIIGIKGLVTWYRPKSYYEAKPWRGQLKYAGGGVMINQSLHTIDLIQLLGGKINSIKATVNQLLDYGIEVEDTVAANIEFVSGAKGLFFATNANAANSSVELQVLLEKGKLTIKDNILTKLNEETGKKEEIIEDNKLQGEKFYYGASHGKLINQFYNCILNNSSDYVHAKDALPSLQVIDAIHKSSELNEAVKIDSITNFA